MASDNPYDYVPPFMYGNISYFSYDTHDKNVLATWTFDSEKVLSELRFPFIESTIPLDFDSSEYGPAELMPGATWYNPTTYPTMFERMTLAGSFWTAATGAVKDAWVFKPTKSGYYRLKIKCSYYLRKYEDIHEWNVSLAIPVQLGVFLLRTGPGRLADYSKDYPDVLGAANCKATLLGLTSWWSGVEGISEFGVVTPVISSPLPAVDMIVHLGAGEEVLPYVSFIATTDNHINNALTWKDVHMIDDLSTIRMLNDQVISMDSSNELFHACVSNDTSFGYELLD